ncbi:MAG: MBL fold metallo-hydrolase [Acidimicrobiales bacterium]|nr:MBL fold metallo-hydrolase [Acidimicrobiales bacterium]
MGQLGDLNPKPASKLTEELNHAARHLHYLHGDDNERHLAERGLIAEASSPQILHAGGWPVWDLEAFEFLAQKAPAEVHPGLWAQAQRNSIAGLFEMAPGFYQVRGLDLANMTVIEAETGWIVIDPLTSEETARAALNLVNEHLGAREVVAVIYTHSHIDHFGGVRGVVDEDDVTAGRVQIIAPAGFLEAAVSENILAGNVMTRRATYMYGALLPKGPRGHVDCGLGKGVPLLASQGLIAPTVEIIETGTEMVVDGVRICFQVTPDTEAPAEMNFHFPDHRILCMAENCTCTMHNLYTPRGAQVRDALSWSKYLQEALDLFGDRSDVCFASHHWPRWGHDEIVEQISIHRDMYRYLHDQTLRMANHGLVASEIAEKLEFPDELAEEPTARGYYGTISHNVKAIYQRYLGWFDANPAHLHNHPPVAAAKRYVEFMGGAESVLAKARKSFEQGDYRWVVEVVNHVVFADPENLEAKLLQADALEQLGYQAESGPWRTFYLSGAQELRHGHPVGSGGGSGPSSDLVGAMSVEMLIDYLAIRLRNHVSGSKAWSLRLEVGDRSESWTIGIQRGTLAATRKQQPDGIAHPELTLRCNHATLASLVFGQKELSELERLGEVEMDGRSDTLAELFAHLDTFDIWFPIVTA